MRVKGLYDLELFLQGVDYGVVNRHAEFVFFAKRSSELLRDVVLSEDNLV